ncbi:MAG: NAD-dependent epimerase/dehydratase family protein [Elusimicrobia bacterium]|nr:NAD-dependent epimerase/dehydratase family protein [Elusimicrobiota bacterium]
MAKRVLVTGSSGYLGRVLVGRLLEHPLVARVVGVDVAASKLANPKFKQHAADIRDEFLLRSILEEEAIDTVFHLAFVMGEPKDEVRARAVNVGGTLNVLEAANKSSTVKRLVVSGSASAYGARRGNPEFLKEENPLRADTLRYGIHKRMVEEEVARSMPTVRRTLQVVILRICTIVGATERGEGPVATFCRLPVGVSVLFHKGALQFIAEDDLMKAMLRVMEADELRGVFNVAPDDYTTIREICRALSKPRVPAPYSLLWLSLFLLRRLAGKTELTENIVSYLAHPAVVSNAKLKTALGIRFPKGSLEAFLDCARALAGSADKAAGDVVR